MPVSDLEVIRAALARGLKREGSLDDTDLKQLDLQMSARMATGDEVRAWDDLYLRFAWMPEPPVAEATERLSRENLEGLLELFSGASPLPMYALARFVVWSDDVGERWLRAPCSRAVAALGVQLWLRAVPALAIPTPENDAAFGAVLDALGRALSSRARDEELALWWQVLGVAYRIAATQTPGVPKRMLSLYEHASVALARIGGGDAMPRAEEFRVWAEGNPELAAVLPSVAEQARQDLRAPLLVAFFSDVDQRLDGQAYAIPDVSRQAGLLYVNACAQAIAMQASMAGAQWWVGKLDEYLARLDGWKAERTDAVMERAAWIGCAVSITVLHLKANGASRALLKELVARVAPRVEDWCWEMGFPFSARTFLQELLVRAALLDAALASSVTRSVVRVARDLAVLQNIRKEVAEVLPRPELDHIDELIRVRTAYELALA